jgi:hypothetical protein
LARESREHPGEYVARAFDGRPLAYAATEAELERRLRAMDLDPEAVVIDFVAPPHLSDAT